MNDLIEALTILSKYLNDYSKKYPTVCEHDILYICGIKVSEVTVEDVRRLYDLGFIPGSDDDSYEWKMYNNEGNCIGDIEIDKIDQETWDKVKNNLSDCFYSFKFGSC